MQAGVDPTPGSHSLASLTFSVHHHRELVIRAKCAGLARHPAGCPRGHVSLGRSRAIGLSAGALQRPECPSWFPFSPYDLARSLRPWRSFVLPTVMGVVMILSTRVPWLASRENFYLPHTLLWLFIGCRVPGLLFPDRHWRVAWAG